jgi:hypothetical protein
MTGGSLHRFLDERNHLVQSDHPLLLLLLLASVGLIMIVIISNTITILGVCWPTYIHGTV